jgi:hypothetical protein
MVMLLMVNTLVPVFDKLTDCVALCVPTDTVPKVMEVVDNDAAGDPVAGGGVGGGVTGGVGGVGGLTGGVVPPLTVM